MTPGVVASYAVWLEPPVDEFPAATTTTAPAFAAALIAASTAGERNSGALFAPVSCASERFTTVAPCFTAHVMPADTAVDEPDPSDPSTRTGMIFARGATDATPTEFPVSAAMMPAINVPCPFSSNGCASLSTKSYPGTSCPCRSGCAESTPVSITATIWPAPRVTAHAVGPPMRTSPHCSG